MAERDGKEEQLKQEVESQRRKENKQDEYREGKRRLSAPSCSTPNPKRALLTTVGKTENETNKEDFTQDCSDNPPCINFEVPKLSDLPKACSKSWNDVEFAVDFLLLTVEDCEFLGFFPYLEEPFKSYRKDVGFVWFGYMGSAVGSTKKLMIALMKCSKGSAVPGGSLTVVKNAVKVLRPKAVFSVGACSGLDRGKVKLGDVVVSSKLITPTHKTPASRDIGTLIRHAADGWNAPLANPNALEVRVHCDRAVLSSPEVISEDMIQQYPEAIAVDTEGEGVFAAAHDLKTEWVVVKGIKDYADDSQPSSDEWGRFASVMAASVVANILSDPVVFEEWSNYNQEASPVDTFNVETCQRKLAEHYQKTAKVPTTVWSSVFQVDLDQIYTRLSWVKEEQTTAGSSKKELGHYTELFTEKTKNGAVPKRILVQGETGIGKTTFVKKLLVDWSNLEEAKMDVEQKDALRKFELVLSVNLKEVSKCQTFRQVISASRLFPEHEEKLIDNLLSYIGRSQEKVLVVFDGYDEYRTGSEAEEKFGTRSNSPIYKIVHGDILRDCTVMVTTRSSRADEIREPADIQAEITGFNMPDRKDFMRKMLGSQTQVNSLCDFLGNSNMQDLARVPLLNLFFCLLWREEKAKLMELVKSKAKLFQAITKHILQHSHRKHFPSHASKLKEESYKEILAEIGKVALAGLFKGDLMLEFGQLPEKVRGEESIIVGLFQLSEYGPSLEPKEMVSFIHKSIQEYLAAWYITYRCIPEGSLGELEQHAHTLEDCEALENVFQFICGLSDDGAVKVFQHLTSVRISDPTLDLSKTIPDVENETVVPLYDITDRHYRFSDLVYDFFREVCFKAELLSHFLDCTGRIVLVDRRISQLIPKVDVLAELAHICVFCFRQISIGNDSKSSVIMYEALEFLNCLQMPLAIPHNSKFLVVGDLARPVQNRCGSSCYFSSILCFRNGQFQFYITEFFLECDDHATLFTKSTVDSVLPSAKSLCSEQSCLKFFSSLHCSGLSGKTMNALIAAIRNCAHLTKIDVVTGDDTICDLLEQVLNPSKCNLSIGGIDESYICPSVDLTSVGAVQLATLLPRFNNTIALGLQLNDCCSAAVDTLVTSITHKTLKGLMLSGIRLTPAAAKALGRSLPEMSSLEVIRLSGVNGNTLEAKEMEALFGGFNKTLPLSKFTFSGFSVRGCLVPLTKSFRFLPNLRKLNLGEFNMDEQNVCHLLESLRFIPNLMSLSVKGKPLRQAHCCTAEVNPIVSATHKTHKQLDWIALHQISLTPAVAAALGRSLPEMSSLRVLKLTGVDGSILEAKEMAALFGGFNKTLPSSDLTFSGFSVRGCLAPLTKSFCFFPNLKHLTLGQFNMDEQNLCLVLECFKFIPNLTLTVKGNLLRQAYCCTVEVDPVTRKNLVLVQIHLDGISLTPAVAAVFGWLLPKISSLEELRLTGVDGSILKAKEMEALFGGLNKTLPLSELTFSGFSVRGCLSPVTTSFCFFPNLRELNLREFNMDEQNKCHLLESLRFIPNLKTLRVKSKSLREAHRCRAEVSPIMSVTHKALEQLHLDGISLTPAVAAVLGRSLPEMPSLKKLELTGVAGSILEAKEMEALFGGFNRTLPLSELSFSGFSVRGCLAPLTKSLPFFPNLSKLKLKVLNVNEHDQCCLLESIRLFVSNKKELRVQVKSLGHAHCSTVEVHLSLVHFENLELNISLTSTVAATLGPFLHEMSSLEVLELTGVNDSILQAEDMKMLFGGFNKTLPLYNFSFSGFSLRGCLAPLTKSLRFFPNLSKLKLKVLNVNEHDQCCLLESIRLFVSNKKELRVQVKSLGQAHCSTVEVHLSHGIDKKLNLNISLTPAVAATLGRLLPEMSSLQALELTGVSTSILQAEDIKMLFGGFNKTLPLYKLTFSGFSLRGCLAPLTNCFCFFPNLRDLELGELNGEFSLDEHNLCGLLESIRTVPNLRKLREQGKSLGHADCFTAEVNTVCKILEKLKLNGISLTPAAAAALSQVLPEMSSLRTLTLTGVDGRTVQAEEMEALFGGFNKTLPLSKLSFSGFSVRGCLTPLTKSFRFLPNLRQLHLGELNLDEQDMRSLLESLLSTPNPLIVRLSGNGLSGTVPFTIRGHPRPIVGFLDLYDCSPAAQEDFDYVESAFRQALPQLVIMY